MRKVLITGYKGQIGTVLTKGLKDDYNLVLADLPECDIRNKERLKTVSKGCECIIHLAWNTKTENLRSSSQDPDNKNMYENVYEVAVEEKVKRVIMASSVQVHDLVEMNYQIKIGSLKRINLKVPMNPRSPYGRNKENMEYMGQSFSFQENLEVICIRFGALSSIDNPYVDTWQVGLGHHDCVDVVKKCLKVEKIESNFLSIFAISRSRFMIHDITNPLGWHPNEWVDSSYNIPLESYFKH